MNTKQYIVAIEIGSSKIVGAIAEKDPNSDYVEVTSLEKEELVDSVRYGRIQNVETTKGAIKRIITKLANRVDGEIKDVYVGLSGVSLHSESCEENRNLDPSHAISDAVIGKIITEARDKVVKGYDIIDVVPRTFIVDNKEVKNPAGVFGENISIKLNLIVAKSPLRINLNRVVDGAFKAHYLITPLAVAENILTAEERDTGCMLIDVGAETTTVAFYKNEALVYLTTLPLGGRNITRDIALGLNIQEETAERVKKNINRPLDSEVAPVIIDDVNSREASNFIVSRVGELIANIVKQCEYADMKEDKFRKVVLIGGGALLQGFQEELESKLQVSVRMGNLPQNLNFVDFSINRKEYIQLFALLAKGVEHIGSGTCIEVNRYYDEPTVSEPRYEPKPEPEPEPEFKPEPEERRRRNRSNDNRRRRGGFFQRFKDKFDDFLTESEEKDMV